MSRILTPQLGRRYVVKGLAALTTLSLVPGARHAAAVHALNAHRVYALASHGQPRIPRESICLHCHCRFSQGCHPRWRWGGGMRRVSLSSYAGGARRTQQNASGRRRYPRPYQPGPHREILARRSVMNPSELPAVLYVDDDALNLRVFDANFGQRHRRVDCHAARVRFVGFD